MTPMTRNICSFTSLAFKCHANSKKLKTNVTMFAPSRAENQP